MNTTFDARKISMAGVLAAIAILLGVTGLGFIPVPTPAQNATIMHVPAIIGGVLGGTPVGWLVGLIFGLFSWLQATTPFFKDPIVAILPRMFIGVFAALTYQGLRRANVNENVAITAAAVVGTLTNTIGVLGLLVLRGYLDIGAALGIAVINGIPEIIVAAIITVAVVVPVRRIAMPRRSTV
ncbi:MAG: ECF transporter S component [Chloroflexi bacterium]|nr:ECF transporter S component [Chloroflexota bacterium]